MKRDEFADEILKKLSFASRIPEATHLEEKDNVFFPQNSLSTNLPSYLDPAKQDLYILLRGGGNAELRFRLPEKVNKFSLYGNQKDGTIEPKYRQQVVLQHKEIDGSAYLFLRGYGNKGYNRYATSIYRINDNSLITPHYKYDIFPYYKSNRSYTNMMELLEIIHERDFIPFDSHLTNLKKEQKVFLFFCVHLFRAEDSGFFSREVPKFGFNALIQGDSPKDAYIKIENYQKKQLTEMTDSYMDELRKLHNNRFEVLWDKDEAYSPVIERLLGMDLVELNKLYSRLNHDLITKSWKTSFITDYEDVYDKTIHLVRIMFKDEYL